MTFDGPSTSWPRISVLAVELWRPCSRMMAVFGCQPFLRHRWATLRIHRGLLGTFLIAKVQRPIDGPVLASFLSIRSTFRSSSRDLFRVVTLTRQIERILRGLDPNGWHHRHFVTKVQQRVFGIDGNHLVGCESGRGHLRRPSLSSIPCRLLWGHPWWLRERRRTFRVTSVPFAKRLPGLVCDFPYDPKSSSMTWFDLGSEQCQERIRCQPKLHRHVEHRRPFLAISTILCKSRWLLQAARWWF